MARGNDYLFGRGVPRDYQQAVTWYRKAVAGSTAAMTNLGFMYQNGYGVDKDDAQTVGWYRKATTAGDAIGRSANSSGLPWKLSAHHQALLQ